MKALQLTRPRVFELVEIPVPELPEGCILVQTGSASLCGSDSSFFNGNKRYVDYPLSPGVPNHENVGTVVESRSGQFRPGDRVLAIPEGDRGLAEYYVALAAKATLLPPELSAHDDCCLIQPLSTVLNAVDQLGALEGKTVAVIGLGSIGLFFCWLLKQRAAGEILGIDPNAHRCQMAGKLGADRTIPMRSVELIHAWRGEPGSFPSPEVVIEAVGHQTETINDCLALVRKYGTVLAFGVPDQPVYPLEYELFFRKNASLIAVVTPDWSDYLARARDLFLNCHPELAWLVTHRMPIKAAAHAFTLYEQHADNILKVILDASSWD